MNITQEFVAALERRSGRYYYATFCLISSSLSAEDFRRRIGFRANHSPSLPDAPRLDHGRIAPTFCAVDARTDLYYVDTVPHNTAGLHLIFGEVHPRDFPRDVRRMMIEGGIDGSVFQITENIMRECCVIGERHTISDAKVHTAVELRPHKRRDAISVAYMRGAPADLVFDGAEESGCGIKTIRVTIPVANGHERSCTFTISRNGCITYHMGAAYEFATVLLPKLCAAAGALFSCFRWEPDRPICFQFPSGIPVDDQFSQLVRALNTIPGSSVAVLHSNPYFHASVVNFDDRGSFDLICTDGETLLVSPLGEVSDAAVARLHAGLSEHLEEATVSTVIPIRGKTS